MTVTLGPPGLKPIAGACPAAVARAPEPAPNSGVRAISASTAALFCSLCSLWNDSPDGRPLMVKPGPMFVPEKLLPTRVMSFARGVVSVGRSPPAAGTAGALAGWVRACVAVVAAGTT